MDNKARRSVLEYRHVRVQFDRPGTLMIEL